MLKKYIQDIAKNEARKFLLSKDYYEIAQENRKLKKENVKLKDLYEQEKNKNYKTLESEELKQENEKLKHENKQLKNLSCTIVVGNDGKLDSLFNQKLKTENEKLKKELRDSKNGLNGANDVIKNTKQENEKLKIKVDEYYNRFLSEGIKKEKAQRLIREIKKEIDSQGFDHEGFYSLQNMYCRIENILKES